MSTPQAAPRDADGTDGGRAADAAPPARSAFRRVVEGAAWMLGSEIGVRAISFFTIVYLSRVLSTTGMGVVEYGMAVFSLVQLVMLGGVDMVMTRQASRNATGLGRMAGTAVMVAWIYFAGVYSVVAVCAWTLPLSPELSRSMLLFGAVAFVIPLGVRFAFVARERLAIVATGALAGQVTFLVLCLLLVRDPGHALRVGALWLVAMLAKVALQLSGFVRTFGWLRLRPRLSRLAVFARSTLALGLANVSRSIAMFVDVLILGLLVTASEVADYALAQKLPLFLLNGLFYVHTVTVPTLSRSIPHADRRRLGAIETDIVMAMLGTALPGMVCLALVAQPLMDVLFTAKFAGAAVLFPILLIRFPLAAVTGLVRNIVWIARPAAAARVASQGLVVTVAAVTGLTLAYGVRGAACGLVCAEVVTASLYALQARPWLSAMRWNDRTWMLRAAIAVAIVAAFAWLVPGLQPIVAIGGAGLAWAAATVTLNLPYGRRLLGEMRG